MTLVSETSTYAHMCLYEIQAVFSVCNLLPPRLTNNDTIFSSSALFQHITALFECTAAAIVTLLLNDPVGQLSIRSCEVKMLSDWYTMLYNPSPDYITTLHCTQEAVFPL